MRRRKVILCHICDYKTNRNTLLKRHIEAIHERKKENYCHLCSFKTARKSYLSNHIRNIHKGGEIKDSNEQESSSNSEHESKKLPPSKDIFEENESKEPHWCDICEELFPTSNELSQHQIVHGLSYKSCS